MKIFLDCNHGLQKWCHMSRSCLAREMTWWLRARLSSYFASQNSDDIYCVLFPLCKWHQLRCLSEIAIPIIIEDFRPPLCDFFPRLDRDLVLFFLQDGSRFLAQKWHFLGNFFLTTYFLGNFWWHFFKGFFLRIVPKQGGS